MKNAHLKDTFRELWKTRSRFIAIFAIIALGTGFFAGVKATCPDMQLTANEYFENYRLMDIRLVSTYGFNLDDIAAVQKLKDIRELMPSYTLDAIVKTEKEDKVAKLHSLPLAKVNDDRDGYLNRFKVVEGRLPEKPGECAIEKGKLEGLNTGLGESITLESGNEDKPINEYLKRPTFKVVGYVQSPYYLTFEKGTSSLGNGTVSMYAVIPEEDFKMEVYTDINLTLESTHELSAFGEEYKEAVTKEKDELKKIAEEREKQRYTEVYKEASDKLEESKKELANGEAEQKQKLSEALEKLDRAQQDIDKGKRELEKQKASYNRKISSAQVEIANAEKQLLDSEKKYSEQAKLFEQNKAFMPILQAQATEATLKKTRLQLDTAAKQLSSKKELFQNSKKEGAAKFDNAALELDAAQKKLNAGRAEYETQKAESDEKLNDARKKIAEAEEKVNDIKKPEWYILDRNNNPGYSSFVEDTKRVDSIAGIFPVFFFAVAAFVCLTTMTRLVEEQRTQIGTLKALGYGNFAIASKYLVYAAIASVSGSLTGLIIGLKLFPFVIANAYGMLYRLPPTKTPLRLDYIVWITLGALACTSLAVYLACYKELMEQPSALMRPKAPKMGKRVLLERITFIWNRLSFFSKVTVRNLFRYKKRLFMTLLGVAGCTSLMLAGFGIRDAISSIVPKQYGEVFKYNTMVILDDNANQQDKNKVSELLNRDTNIKELFNVRIKNYEAGYQGDWQKINLIVPETTEGLEKFISVHKMGDKKPIELTDEGVVIGEKLSKVLQLKVGDSITIKDGDFKNVEVKVTGVNENYALHYVYMTKSLYEQKFGEKPVLNGILLKLNEVSEQADNEIGSKLVENKAVLQVNSNRTNQKNFSDMVGSLNSIVLVMIISAGTLAFVVLYNLTNININERIREIASIKVLGFYDLEVSEYVFRENIILTIINVIIGLLGGNVLNRFVLNTAETDLIMFGREIYWYSYLMAAVLTVVFALLVNVVMHIRLKKVSMVESLKSVE